MTLENMLDRGYSLEQISHEVRRVTFARVLREECKLRGRKGAKSRAAIRLGVHRNTVSRELWTNKFYDTPIEWERDPPLKEGEA